MQLFSNFLNFYNKLLNNVFYKLYCFHIKHIISSITIIEKNVLLKIFIKINDLTFSYSRLLRSPLFCFALGFFTGN